jgi:hypothetical protein
MNKVRTEKALKDDNEKMTKEQREERRKFREAEVK